MCGTVYQLNAQILVHLAVLGIPLVKFISLVRAAPAAFLPCPLVLFVYFYFSVLLINNK